MTPLLWATGAVIAQMLNLTGLALHSAILVVVAFLGSIICLYGLLISALF